jgi:hypothetical protein
MRESAWALSFARARDSIPAFRCAKAAAKFEPVVYTGLDLSVLAQ